ncbi:unnamed protein product [Prunus armeniaca]
MTSAIPIYAMQTIKLPISVCVEMDHLNRNFFWGGNENKTEIHLCQWNLVCRPKCKGDLSAKGIWVQENCNGRAKFPTALETIDWSTRQLYLVYERATASSEDSSRLLLENR